MPSGLFWPTRVVEAPKGPGRMERMAIPEGLNGMNGKVWARAARERIGMTQRDAAVLANLTVDMVKKYESEKYRIQPSERMREMVEHYLAEHRRAVKAIVERHRGEERAVLSFSRVSNLPEWLPDWVRAEASVKRRAAAVREAVALLEAAGVAVTYTYLPEETME